MCVPKTKQNEAEQQYQDIEMGSCWVSQQFKSKLNNRKLMQVEDVPYHIMIKD